MVERRERRRSIDFQISHKYERVLPEAATDSGQITDVHRIRLQIHDACGTILTDEEHKDVLKDEKYIIKKRDRYTKKELEYYYASDSE